MISEDDLCFSCKLVNFAARLKIKQTKLPTCAKNVAIILKAKLEFLAMY